MHFNRLFPLVVVFGTFLMAVPNIFATPAQTVNLPAAEYGIYAEDDEIPDVTDRVARISFIKGDVQIKRADNDTWERATLNLPIVEGDEITTSANSRFEIQFSNFSRLRLAENGYIKIVKLLDEGIAVSVPQGTISVRLTEFDKDRTYFEMDAPGTTIAVQRAGLYRLDAGSPGTQEIRLRVTENGEARIYSETSGFTLKNGRSARVFIGGNNVGEWEPGDASLVADEFDTWAVDRDTTIAIALKKAHYDKYYDRDIYGADDLNDFGEWVYTKKYGYVWRPFSGAISSYANWSPYRYGQWRWVPPYGWTWVNDEPWGWATYHHGRWVFDSGYWYWSPYGYYRYGRSWWSPALVVVTILNNNVCWYPLPYSYAYFNYNYYYHSHGGWNGGHHGGPVRNGNGGPLPTPTPAVGIVPAGPLTKIRGPKQPPFESVPATGVVSLPMEQFGGSTRTIKVTPIGTATAVLAQTPDDRRTTPFLPTYSETKSTRRLDIVADKPRIANVETFKTGATSRLNDAPLDQELRTTRVFGGRPPVTIKSVPSDLKIDTERTGIPVKTGAVDRPPRVTTNPNADDVRKPVKPETTVRETDVRQVPRDIKPPKQETPRYEPPPREAPTRSVQPPTRTETPRPTKRPDAPTKVVSPPKSEPRPPDKRPTPSETRIEKKKDGGR